MNKIKILVVDDAVVARKFLTDLLVDDPEFEVVGAAANGRIALSKIAAQRPDVVVLDVEMPVMDGLETLREIKMADPGIRVIMFSIYTSAGARETVDALAMGAEDYVHKPSANLMNASDAGAVRDELISKIKTVVGRGGIVPVSAPRPAPPRSTAQNLPPTGIDVVAIGSSTGGPNALAQLFGHLPRNLPVPIVIAQHMPPTFTQLLAERLTRDSGIKTHEAKEGDVLKAGDVWIAPGDYHMTLSRNLNDIVVHLNQEPPENSCRPSADVLFRSVETVFKNRSLAIVLTGMGEDGFQGAQLLHDAGAQILVQDEASSVVWGMAGAVANAGLANQILPIDQLASEIIRRSRIGKT